MIDREKYIPPPPVLPLELVGEALERYNEVRRLRRRFDSSGERSVRWNESGEPLPGILYPRSTVYDFPGDPLATGPSGE